MHSEKVSALGVQVGGSHYKDAAIQPVQYIEANALPFLEGCVVKRVTRHAKPTGKGRQDIEKAIHELQLLLELRYPVAVEPVAVEPVAVPVTVACGWIKWGGFTPELQSQMYPPGITRLTPIHARFRDGSCSGLALAEFFGWSHCGTQQDIIAYRLAK